MTTAQLTPPPRFQAFDNAGLPLAGGLLYSYAAGTTTPQATYPSSSERTPNANPVVLDFRGSANVWLDPTLSYKLNLTDSLGNQIYGWPIDNIPGGTLPITQAQIGELLWPQTSAELAAGVTPSNYAYAPGDVRRYGVIGNGTNDDTTALQTAYLANPGMDVYHGDGLQITISSPINLYSGSRYYGRSIIRQKAGANMGAGSPVNMLTGTSCMHTTFEDLEIDGNAANNSTGIVHGIQFIGGSYNSVKKIYVHDTTQAGIYLAQETGSNVLDNWVINCGRNLSTDNHGIMMISNTSTPLSDINCSRNFVSGAYRKGITTYALTPGYCQNVLIEDNVCIGCGLGGIYVAVANSSTPQNVGFVINGNTCSGNYANFQVYECTGFTCNGNYAANDTGGGNFLLGDLLGGTVANNVSLNSQVAGFAFPNPFLTNNLNVSITGNSSLFSNRSGAGYGPGIDLGASQYCNVTGNICNDTPGSAKQTFGVSENTGSDYNQIQANQINNATSSNLHIVGSHTVYQLALISAAVQQLSNGSTITNSPALPGAGGVAVNRISMTTAGASVTGIILGPGTFPGMTCVVVNEDGSHTATMAASGTSNVADGANCVIGSLAKETFVWDTGTSLWYH